MLRYLAGAASMLLMLIAGLLAWRSIAGQAEQEPLPEVPPAAEAPLPLAADGGPPTPPAADQKSREERRFARADRDDDGRITLLELFHPRRAAFARLDRNGDGRLAFEEWATKTHEKFARADRNRDAALDAAEYRTTAPPRRPRRCAC